VVAWLDRHVRDVADAPAVPVFTTVDQAGTRWRAPQGPTTATFLTGVGDGALVLDDDSRAGPPTSRVGVVSALDETMLAMTPAPVAPDRAIEIPVEVPAGSFVVGSPRLTLRYLGAPAGGPATTRVYAQVVDPATGEVVGGQITPIEVVLDGRPRRVEVALEALSWRADGAARLVVQIVATTPLYTDPALGGAIAVWRSEVALPVVTDLERVAPA
jgi:ABC-2 type transport system ATP-binding protein